MNPCTPMYEHGLSLNPEQLAMLVQGVQLLPCRGTERECRKREVALVGLLGRGLT